MDKLQEKENSYLTELKSLFQDKFFMLLLGISVAIVLLSTVYSAIKPKNPSIASGAQTKNEATATDGLKDQESEGLAGLEENMEAEPSPTEALKVTQAQMAISPTLVPTNVPTKAEVTKVEEKPVVQAQNNAKTVKPAKSEYVVKAGDTLWAIAEANYGSGYNFTDIAANNKLANADSIEVGQKLKLPGAEVKVATTGDITPEAAMTSRADQAAKSHKVVEGDNLWNISIRYFGNGYEWPRLASVNKIYNPDLIYPEQVIALRN